MLEIRNEEEADRETVEKITRRAFYNLYAPGCVEHYLVHVMRQHEDFVPELDLVAELDGQVIGNVMYTRAWLEDESGRKREALTLGPVCITPEHQRRGYGTALMRRSFERATGLGHDVIVLFGVPGNYVGLGFKSCRKHNVCLEGGKFPTAMLVKELREGALDGTRWFYHDSPVMGVCEQDARRYDEGLAEKMQRGWQPSQEEFYIMSHSFVE